VKNEENDFCFKVGWLGTAAVTLKQLRVNGLQSGLRLCLEGGAVMPSGLAPRIESCDPPRPGTLADPWMCYDACDQVAGDRKKGYCTWCSVGGGPPAASSTRGPAHRSPAGRAGAPEG
jgi:hypothetical protein